MEKTTLKTVVWREKWVLSYEQYAVAPVHQGIENTKTEGLPLTILSSSAFNPYVLKERRKLKMKLSIEEKRCNKQGGEDKQNQEQSLSHRKTIPSHGNKEAILLLKLREKEIQRCVVDRQCALSILKRDGCIILQLHTIELHGNCLSPLTSHRNHGGIRLCLPSRNDRDDSMLVHHPRNTHPLALVREQPVLALPPAPREIVA